MWARLEWMGPEVVELGDVLLVNQLWIGEPGMWKLRTRSEALKEGVKIRRVRMVSVRLVESV